MKGWFGYSVNNMVVLEEFKKERSQKVISFAEPISVMLVTKDGKYLVVGAACPNSKGIANISIFDCTSMIILKTLAFHTKGVQQLCLSKNEKILISVGNFRESTVAVWEFQTGKLLASSYTLDKINDIKISQIVNASNRSLEFCTVGKDQI